jgi:hypothetical protein
MVKRVLSFFVFILMLATASLSMAGGVVNPACGPGFPAAPYAPAGNPCAYWGDAPFPGLCGGVVALPFLVVGSLLGGNTVGPCGPVPAPPYRYVPRAVPGPVYGQTAPCGPGYGPVGGNSILTGLPCLDLCSSLLGSAGGSFGLGL